MKKVKLSQCSRLKYGGKDYEAGSVVEVPDDVGNALIKGNGATLVESSRSRYDPRLHEEREKKKEE